MYEHEFETSADYKVAILAHDAAFAVYDVARMALRAGAMPEAEFIRARAAWDVANAAFDAAFNSETN